MLENESAQKFLKLAPNRSACHSESNDIHFTSIRHRILKLSSTDYFPKQAKKWKLGSLTVFFGFLWASGRLPLGLTALVKVLCVLLVGLWPMGGRHVGQWQAATWPPKVGIKFYGYGPRIPHKDRTRDLPLNSQEPYQ